MARSTRPVVHYMATRPDGTVPPNIEDLARYARARGEQVPTVNLADHLGQVVDHPSPGRKWYTDRAFGYFHMYTRPGELLSSRTTGRSGFSSWSRSARPATAAATTVRSG